MKKIKLKLDGNATEFLIPDDLKKGLLGTNSFPDKPLFFPNSNHCTMKGMKYPIKLGFLDKNYNLIDLVDALPEKSYINKQAKHFIELPNNTDVKNVSKMALLDHKGSPQMFLEGGELVFSRVSTKKIVELAAKANSTEGLKKLGEYVYKERMAQRSRAPQYSS